MLACFFKSLSKLILIALSLLVTTFINISFCFLPSPPVILSVSLAPPAETGKSFFIYADREVSNFCSKSLYSLFALLYSSYLFAYVAYKLERAGFGAGFGAGGAGGAGFGAGGAGLGAPGRGFGEPKEVGAGLGAPGTRLGAPGTGVGEPKEVGTGVGEPGAGLGEPERGLGEPGRGLGEPKKVVIEGVYVGKENEGGITGGATAGVGVYIFCISSKLIFSPS